VDPLVTISATIVAALAKLSETAVQDAYRALKNLICRKYGHGELPAAVDGLEKKPNSAGHEGVLREELSAAGADRDQELMSVVAALSRAIEHAGPATAPHVEQTVTGNANVFSGTGNVTVQRG